MTTFPSILILLAQLSGCASVFCSLSIDDEFAPRRLRVAIRDVQDIIPLGDLADEDFVVVSPPFTPIGALEITRVGPGGEEVIASIPPQFPQDIARFLTAGDGRWWFSRSGSQDVGSSAFFVAGAEGHQQTAVRLPGELTRVWLPVRGEQLRGLLVSVSEEDSALQVDEVTPAGVKRLGEFPWREFHRTLHVGNWSVQALAGDRFAIVSVDNPPEAPGLKLRIVGDGETTESALSCRVTGYLSLGTAVDTDGRLAIVVRSSRGEVVAMLVDIDRPERAECRVISAPGEVAAQTAFGSPVVVHAGDRFIAAWIRDDHKIRACELTDAGLPPVIIDAGDDADVRFPLRQLLHTEGEFFTIIWKDRGGELMARRLPRDLTGYAMFTELRRLLCPDAGN